MARALASTLALALLGQAAAAETRVGAAAGAIIMGQAGIEAADPGYLTSAAEALRALAPSGDAEGLAKSFAEEARFLARGDEALLARLDAMDDPATDRDTRLWILPVDGTLTVPEGQGLLELALVASQARAAFAPDGSQVCSREGLSLALSCDPLRATGVLSLDKGTGAGLAILATTDLP